MKKIQDDENGELTIRFFEVSVKGSNATIQESVKQAANVAIHRALASSNGKQALPPANKIASPQKEFEFEQDAVEGEVEEPQKASVSSTAKSSRPRTVKTPEILHDLDLESGDVTFETFCREKNPTSDNKKYLVIATWFKEYRHVDAISPSHVYTCYRAMSWTNYPTDFGKPFRNSKDSGWFKNVGQNLWEINHLGLAVVNKMNKK